MDQSIAAMKAEMALEVARLEALYPPEQQVVVGTERDSVLRKRYHRICMLRNDVNQGINTLVQKFHEHYHGNPDGNDCLYAAALPFGTTLPDADAVHAGTLWVMPFVRIERREDDEHLQQQIVNTGLKYYIVPLVADWVENARFITNMPTYHWKTLPGRLFALEETPNERQLPSRFPEGPNADFHVVNAFLDEHEHNLRGMHSVVDTINHYEPDF